MPFKTARFFQGRPRRSFRRGGPGTSLSRVSHGASVRSRVLVRGIESIQINRCKRVLCWLLLFNSSGAFGRSSHAAQVTVMRPEQTFGRQHRNEHALATSTVALPKLSWCCAGHSYTPPTLRAHNTHPRRSARLAETGDEGADFKVHRPNCAA